MAMRIEIIAVVITTLALASCTVVGVAADAASVAGTVVTTTVSTAGAVAGAAGDVVGAAAHTVTGGSSSDQDKKK